MILKEENMLAEYGCSLGCDRGGSMPGSRHCRQRKREGRSFAGSAAGSLQAPAMHFGQCACDIQAETEAARFSIESIAALMEAFEETVECGLRRAGAGVGYDNLRFAGRRRGVVLL